MARASITKVVLGGTLSNNKGINRMGGGLTAPALTAKDMDDVKTAAMLEADYLAVSFPKNKEDMYMARQLLRAAGGRALLIAKIERAEAITYLDEIIDASDGIMVARGDLAVEVGNAVGAGPAEADDQARARAQQAHDHRHADDGVDDPRAGADARRGVRRRQRRARRHRRGDALRGDRRRQVPGRDRRDHGADLRRRRRSPTRSSSTATSSNRTFTRLDQSIAMATLFTAFHLKVKAIASLTDSGSTALWMSRHNCGCPIFALTPKIESQRKMALYRNVQPLFLEQSTDRDAVLLAAEALLVAKGEVRAGRSHRAHHRRADGQVRRHEHDEDRPGRGASLLTPDEASWLAHRGALRAM